MLISRKQNRMTNPPTITINCNALETDPTFKYLGLLFTSDLSWSRHIEGVCTKAKKILGLLYRRFYQYADQQTLRQPLDSSRSLWMWPEAVLYVHSVFGSSSILHSLWYHCREGYPCGVCITTAKSAWWSTLLLQLREFTPVGGNCKVYLPDKGTRNIWAAKGGWVFYYTFLRVLMLKCKPCCQIQIVNFQI